MANSNDNNNGFFSVFSSNGSGGGGGGSTSGKGIHALAVDSGNNISANILYTTLTTMTLDKTLMVVFPFYPANNFTISSFKFIVTTAIASSSATLVVYDDLNGLPNNLIYNSGAVSTTTTGTKTIVVTNTFAKGTTYYIGLYTGATGLVVNALAKESCYCLGFNETINDFFNAYTGNSAFGVPDPFGTATDYRGNVPYISMVIA